LSLDKIDLSVIRDKIQRAYAFCLFSKPNEIHSELFVQEYEEQSVPEEGFCFAPFDTNTEHTAIYISSDCKWKLDEDGLSYLGDIDLPLGYVKLKTESFEQYAEIFSKFHKELNSDSDLEKLVLSRVLDKAWSGQPIALFNKIKNKYPENFVYLLNHPDSGLWLAASPETLLEIEAENVNTMALAGTAMPNDSEKISWGDKEIEEHQFVVDYIKSTLSKAGCSNVLIGNRQTIRAGKVYHLMTPISARLKDESAWRELSQEMHPTPAVCGTPKLKARDFILENERHDRAFYCGFVGPYTKARVNLYVNLRCLQVFDNKVSLFLGGGITKASVLEKEWKETENKAMTLLDCLK